MNYSYLLLCIFIIPLLLRAQNPSQIILSSENKTLPDVFQQIEADYDLSFIYNPEEVKELTALEDIIASDLSSALSMLLRPHKLSYKLMEGGYVVIKKAPRNIQSANSRIQGRIIDEASQQALPHASVFIKRTLRGTYTDVEGRFKIKEEYLPDDTLVVRYLGYEALYIPCKLVKGSGTDIWALRPRTHTLADVVIAREGVKPIEFEGHLQGINIRPDKLAATPGWGEPDLFRIAELLPGIAGSDGAGGGLHIRGGTPDQNEILWEGIPIHHATHFFGNFSAFNPYIVKEAQIYRGGFGVQYGGKISGIFDITSKPDTISGFHLGVGANLMNIQGYIELPVSKEKSSLLIGFRRSFSDIIRSPFYNNLFSQVFQQGKIFEDQSIERWEGLELNLIPVFKLNDINIKWAYRPSEKTDFSISFFHADDQLDYTSRADIIGEISYLTSDELRMSNWGIGTTVHHNWNKNFRTRIQSVFSDYQYNYNSNFRVSTAPNNPVSGSQQNPFDNLNLRLDQYWDISPNHQLYVGVERNQRNMELGFHFEETENDTLFIYDETFEWASITNSLYGQYQGKLFPFLTLESGLRYNFYTATGQRYWEPRLSLHIHPSKILSFKASFGIYHQYANQIIEPNELGVADRIWVLADEDGIPVVSSPQLLIGARLQKPGFRLDVELYEKYITGLTTFALRFENQSPNPLTLGEGWARGMDILLARHWKKYSSFISYSISEAIFQFPEVNHGDPFYANFDQRHRLKWTHTLYLKQWNIAATWHFGSGRPYTPVYLEGARNDNGEYFIQLEEASRNGARLPNMHHLDIAATYSFPIGNKWNQKGKLGFSIINIYNHSNIYSRLYQFDWDDGSELFPSGILLENNRQELGFTPNFYFQLEW